MPDTDEGMIKNNFYKPSIWYVISKHQAKLAGTAAAATILGVYLNASFNYANLMMNRSRQAVELLKSVNEAELNSDTRTGRACLKYATDFADENTLADLWVKDTEDFSLEALPPRTDTAASQLSSCLSSFRYRESSPSMDALLGAQQTSALKKQISAYIARQTFGFLNSYENIFVSWKDNKADHMRLCEQLENNAIREPLHNFLIKGKNALKLKSSNINVTDKHGTRIINGSDIVIYYYPATDWFLYSDKHCSDGYKSVMRNYVSPLFPFLSLF